VIPLGHMGGMPIEELLPALVGGGAGLLAARAWLSLQLRRDRRRESTK
jgi:hypothetical protein